MLCIKASRDGSIDYNCWIPTGYIAIWWDFYFIEDDGEMQGVYKLELISNK